MIVDPDHVVVVYRSDNLGDSRIFCCRIGFYVSKHLLVALCYWRGHKSHAEKTIARSIPEMSTLVRAARHENKRIWAGLCRYRLRCLLGRLRS